MRSQKYKRIKPVIVAILLLLTFFTVSVNASSANELSVNFKVDVSSELNEYYNYIYVTVQNKETYDLYDFNVYRKDGWVATVDLPAGKYSVVAGGILNDWQNNYPIEHKSFEISDVSSKDVRIKCGNDNISTGTSSPSSSPALTGSNNTTYAPNSNSEFTGSPSSQTTRLISSEPDSESRHSEWLNIIPFAVVAVALIYYFYRKKKANNESD